MSLLIIVSHLFRNVVWRVCSFSVLFGWCVSQIRVKCHYRKFWYSDVPGLCQVKTTHQLTNSLVFKWYKTSLITVVTKGAWLFSKPVQTVRFFLRTTAFLIKLQSYSVNSIIDIHTTHAMWCKINTVALRKNRTVWMDLQSSRLIMV